MTWVKLCGMTRPEDVAAAVDLGADAVGFIVAPSSPRRVDPERAAALGRGLGIARFLVTVDATADDLIAMARASAVTGVQPHGRGSVEAAVAALAVGFEVLFPVPVFDTPPDLGAVPDGARPILDTGGPGVHGGSGRPFAWTHARNLGGEFVVAGGLTPDTVSEAVRLSGAWGVDVASGVEHAPGIKDHDAMKAFIEAVR